MMLTTSYENADLDGLACSVGMAELLRTQGEDVKAVMFGVPSIEARWVCDTYTIPLPPDGQPHAASSAEVVLLDASDPRECPFPIETVVEIIDHRDAHRAAEFPNAKRVQIELVGSCATLVTERIRQSGTAPSRDTARLLTGAIISNTVNLRSPLTTDRDRAAAALLASVADLPPTFSQDMFAAKSDLTGSRLRETLLGDYTVKEYAGTRYVGLQVEANGVATLFRTRREEILTAMRDVQHMERCAFVFGSGLDLTAGTTRFLIADAESKRVLEQALGVRFGDDGVAVMDAMMMRKQMHPKIKRTLESSEL